MLKSIIHTGFLFALVSTFAFSQDSPEVDDNPFRIGLGVSLNVNGVVVGSGSIQIGYLPLGFTQVYVPMFFSENFRVEPELGFFSVSDEDEGYDASLSAVRVGIGFSYVFGPPRIEGILRPNVVFRVGMLSLSRSTTYTITNSTTKISENDLIIALGSGCEYIISHQFTIGAEVQLNYTSFGEPKYTPEPPFPDTEKIRFFNLNTLIFIRWYFWD